MSDVIPEYKMVCTPDMTCVEVTFTNPRSECPIHIRFTDKDVSVIGDYGCWVNYPRPEGCGLVRLPLLPLGDLCTIGRLTDALPSRFLTHHHGAS